MATRAPSLANRVATPRPIPRLPPVTSATRFRNDMRPLAQFDSLIYFFAGPSPRITRRNMYGRADIIAQRRRARRRRLKRVHIAPQLLRPKSAVKPPHSRSVEARDNDGHVVGLFRGAGPFFHAGHQRFANFARTFVLHAHRGLLEARDA